MKRLLMVLVLVLPLGLIPPAAATQSARGALHGWQGEPAMVSNFGLVRSGEFIYQDYLYDDHGPNTDGISHTDAPLGAFIRPGDPTNPGAGSSGGQVRHAGDHMYAADSSGYYLNVADLVEFRTARHGDDVYYLFRLGALGEPDDAVIGVCVDTDGRAETGLVEWPFQAGLSQALGCDHHLTVHGTDTQVTDATGASTSLAALGGETRADVEANTIEVRVPTTVADPGRSTWRHYVASGLWDADAGAWTQVPATPSNPGSPVVTGGGVGMPMIWDLLSNNDEPNHYWREERQADDLARGDIAQHFVDVSFERLRQPHDDPDPQLTGVVNRIYKAQHPMDPSEGIRFQAVSLGPRNYVYYGDHQPYAMVIPETYYEQLALDESTTLPFDLCLHPLNGNHHVEIYYAEVEAQRNYVPGVTGTTPHTGYLGFTEYESQINRQNLIYACVNGRGEAVGFTGGDGMVDALEVMRDVRSRYQVDDDQTTIHGISLGAIGSWYMSTLYPDMFSAVLPSIFTGSTEHLTNLYNLLAFYTIGTFDQFAQGVAAGDRVADTMTELGNEFLYYRHLARFHELSLGNEGNPFAEPLFYDRRRVVDPPRVRFVHDAARYSDKVPGDGGAYWVDAMTARGEGQSSIDVISLARAEELPTDQVVFDGVYENTREGYQARMRGLLRMSPEEFAEAWQPAQFQEGWRELDLQVTHTELPAIPPSNGFQLESENLAATTLDTERMLVDTRRPISATVQGDGTLALTLRSPVHGAHHVTLDSEPVAVSPTDGGITMTLALTGAPQTLHIVPVPPERIGGPDRVATAIMLSQAAFDTAPAAVLARADDFPDALAAAPLATVLGGPLLLTGTDALDERVADELARLEVQTVYLSGGEGALSPEVADAVAVADRTVSRLAGAERYSTAVQIAEEVVALGSAGDDVVLASGEDFPDALVAGNVATHGRMPVLLTAGARLPDQTATALDRLVGADGSVVIAGGAAAVSAGVVDAVADRGHTTERISGANRYETAVALAEAAGPMGADLDVVWLASGSAFPDALAAMPVVHAAGGVLLLVDPTDLTSSPAIARFLEANGAGRLHVTIVGGDDAVTPQVADQVRAAAGQS